MQMGAVELLVVMVIVGFNLAIPTVVLVFAVLIYRKLDRIEKALSQPEE